MNRLLIITIFLTLALQTAQGQKKPGEKMPDTAVEAVLQAPRPEISSWNDLKGKWLLIEFWATWCAPCITNIPILNRLDEEMSGDNIQFISLTTEAPEIVTRFLKRKPISGWVGMDLDGSTMKALNVRFYPTTILVNPDGFVHAHLKAKTLTRDTLLKIMEVPAPSQNHAEREVITELQLTQKLAQSSNKSGKLSLKEKKSGTDEVKPLYEVAIWPTPRTTGASGMYGKKIGRLSVKGITLRQLMLEAYGVSPFLVVGNDDLLDSTYNARVSLPRGDVEVFERTLQAAITDKLKVKIGKEFREVTLYELTAPEGVTRQLLISEQEKGKASSDEGVIAGVGQKIDGHLLSAMEDVLKSKIIDKTGLAGKYDFNLYWDADDPESLIPALQEQLGLTLTRKTLEMEVLVVDNL